MADARYAGTRKSPGIVQTIVQPLLNALREWGLTFEVTGDDDVGAAAAAAAAADDDDDDGDAAAAAASKCSFLLKLHVWLQQPLQFE